AHGGEAKLKSFKAFQSKSKGTLEIMGMKISFSQEAVAAFSGKLKNVMEMDVSGMKVRIISVFDGTKGWLAGSVVNKEMDDKMIAETKEALYVMDIERLAPLKADNTLTLTSLGESRVNDRPAAGVRVSKAGHRDVSLYFDKTTGLLAKVEHRAAD